MAESATELVQALESPQAVVRIDAAKRLGELRERESVSGLIRALQDSEPLVRRVAAWSLGQIKDATALHALSITLSDSDEYVVEASVFALGALGRAEAIAPIFEKVADLPIRVKTTVGRRGASRIVDPLHTSESVNLKSAALHSLRAISNSDHIAIMPLVKALRHRSDTVRFVAARTLSRHPSSAAIAALNQVALANDPIIVGGAYRHFMADENPHVRNMLRLSFDRTNDPAILGAMLRSKSDTTAKWAVSQARKRGFGKVDNVKKNRLAP